MPGKTADIAISPEDREWLLAALRHLRQTLEQRLEGCDLTPERRRTLLAAGEQALSGTDFAALDPGFALFLTEDRVETLPLGEAPPQDISAVGHRFLLRPILDRLSAGKRFHILAMSAGGTRLIEATPESSRETTPSGLPQSLSEVAAQTDAEITSRANAPGRGDAGEATSATRHSYESPAELHKTQLVDYVRHSVNTVRRHLAGDPAPWGAPASLMRRLTEAARSSPSRPRCGRRMVLATASSACSPPAWPEACRCRTPSGAPTPPPAIWCR